MKPKTEETNGFYAFFQRLILPEEKYFSIFLIIFLTKRKFQQQLLFTNHQKKLDQNLAYFMIGLRLLEGVISFLHFFNF